MATMYDAGPILALHRERQNKSSMYTLRLPVINKRAQSVLIGDMRFMEMKASTFLIREKRFDAKAFGIATTRLFCGGQIREQMERLFIPFRPATEEHHRPIGFLRHADIRQLDEGPRLDTGGHGLAPEGLPVPQHGDVASRPHHIGPMIVLHGLLERGAIALAIAQQHHLRPRWYLPLDLRDQGEMEVFG